MSEGGASETSVPESEYSDAPPSDILRHLDTAKRKGREKANLNWVLPLVSQWQGEDYKKLCQAMIEIPALAEEGFSRLVALEPDRDHLDHARTARTANARAFRALRSEDYGLPSPRWQSAASVLLAHDETSNVDPALLKLYQADPDDFLTDATTYTNPRAAKRARQPIAHRIQEAVDAWRHRNLTTDLTPLFVEPLNSGIVPPSIEDYALHIPNVATWIVNLREGLEAHTFAPALHRLSQNEALFWDCLDHVYQNPGPNSKIQDAIAFGQHPLLHSSTYADLTSTLKHLKRSPFLAGIQEFRTYPR